MIIQMQTTINTQTDTNDDPKADGRVKKLNYLLPSRTPQDQAAYEVTEILSNTTINADSEIARRDSACCPRRDSAFPATSNLEYT